jgi:hypothetical protein
MNTTRFGASVGTASGSGLPTGEDDLSALVRVHVWGYPLVFAARLRQNMTLTPVPMDSATSRSAAAPINTFGHQRLLSDATYRVGVAPNVDTLYSVAWVDLADGPVMLDTPDFSDRYYSFQVGFADSSSLAVGHRTHGAKLPRVTLRVQGSHPPLTEGLHLTSPTRYAMLAGRILVDPAVDTDFEVAHRLQDGVRLTRWRDGATTACTVSEQTPLDSGTEGLADGPAYLRRLATVLADWLPDIVPPDVLGDLYRAGFDETLGLVRTVEPALIERAVVDGNTLIERAVRTAATASTNHWAVNYQGCEFGADWLLRAAVAHTAIYVNPVAEALYPVAELDSDGRPLAGRRRYQICFPPNGLPPASYFWSLTMYHDRGFLVDNPIDRYAIGDRTPGLRFEEDGRLILQVSHSAPREGIANWLPAPHDGFRLMLRLYGPTPNCLPGRWSPPPIVAVSDAETT